MENLLLLVHLIVALVIVGLILLQQGKGAEMGASFGSGASQTLFGASGTGNFFARMTALAAAVFFVTSISLAVVAKNKVDVTDDIIPSLEEQNDIPTIEVNDVNDSADDIPVLDDAAIEAVEDSAKKVIEEATEEPEVPELPE